MPRPTRQSGLSGDAAEAAAEVMAERARRLAKRRKTFETPHNSAATASPAAAKKDKPASAPDADYSEADDKPQRKKRRPNSLVMEVEFSPEFASARTDLLAPDMLNPNSTNSQQWYATLERLKSYKALTGHCNVPFRFAEDKALGSWIRSQRQRYATRKMPDDRRQALEALGFEWRLQASHSIWANHVVEDPASPEAVGEMNGGGGEEDAARPPLSAAKSPGSRKSRTSLSAEENWNAQLKKVKEFHEQHGHWNVPMKLPEDQKFSNWVRTQRDNFNYETRANVPLARVAKLNEIGFDWKTPTNRAPPKTWEEMLVDMQTYSERNDGHFDSLFKGRTVLGQWIGKQREAYHAQTLSPDQIAKLEALGMDWTAPVPPQKRGWEQQITALRDFKAIHGHVDVKGEDRSLRMWVIFQRKFYHKQKLTTEQVQQLEELGFDWGPAPPVRRGWDDLYEELKRYQEATFHTNVPYKYSQDPELGKWVGKQKDLYQRQLLEADKIHKLEAIGFDWANYRQPTSKRSWDDDFEAMRVFKEAHGHCNPTSLYHEHPGLCLWAARQRDNHHKQKLPADQTEQLNSLDFDWAGQRRYKYSKEEVWYAHFRKLEAFQMEHGHCGTIDKFPESSGLMDWMSQQHVLYLKRKLSDDQVAQLESLGFAWRYDIEINEDNDVESDDGDRKMPAFTNRAPRVSWEQQLDNLKVFKNQYDSFNVPPEYDPKLFEWVKNQRKAFGKGKGITPKKVEKLNEVGFGWAEEPPMDGSLVVARVPTTPQATVVNTPATASPLAAAAAAETPLTPLANAAASRLPISLAHASTVATAAAAARATTNLQTSPLATSAAANLHSASARSAAASAHALQEAKDHRMRLQSELNQCRLSLHHLDKTNTTLSKQLEESETVRTEEALIMKNKLRGHEEELKAQQTTIQSQTQQLTQLFQQIQEMRTTQHALLHTHQNEQLQQQNQQYNLSYRL